MLFSSGTSKTNEGLIELLKYKGVIKSSAVANAMKLVDRKDFVINGTSDYEAYNDCPQSIGFGATISAPHMHAYALELLKDAFKPGGKALDVGSGTGILTLLFYLMMGPGSRSFGIEHIPELVNMSILNLNKHHKNLLDNGSVKIVEGDGRMGLPSYAPYDLIHVGAAATSVPDELIKQLAIGGKLMIPVGPQGIGQDLLIITKKPDGTLQTENKLSVVYVPLTSKKNQVGK